MRRHSAARLLRSVATPYGDGAALKFERTFTERKLSYGHLSPRGEILPITAKDCSLWKVIPSGAGWPVEHLRRSLPNSGADHNRSAGVTHIHPNCSIALQQYHGAANRANRPVTFLRGTRYSRATLAYCDKVDTIKRSAWAQGNWAVEKGTLLLKSYEASVFTGDFAKR